LGAVSTEASAGMGIALEGISAPSEDLDQDLSTLLTERACRTELARLQPLATQPPNLQLALLFAVAWLRVAGTPDTVSTSW